MSDKLLTLDEVRAHIERRVRECRAKEEHIASTYDDRHEAWARRSELTEILALLDRVKDGGVK